MSINVDTIAGPDGDSFKFGSIGDIAKGIIIHAEQMRRESQFSGNVEEVLRISLETDTGDTLIIWPVTNTNFNGDGYATRMAKAIAAAVRAAGQRTLEIGGTLAVQYSRDIPTDRGNPAKGYVAEYKPPVVAPPVADDSGDDGAITGLI
jgi:hypothetical protein